MSSTETQSDSIASPHSAGFVFQRWAMEGFFRVLFRLFFRIEVKGLENRAKKGKGSVYVVNHVSLADGLLVALFLPGRPVFVINTYIARKWWAKFFLRLCDNVTLDPLNPLSLKTVIREIDKGRAVVIFPEGRLSDTGALMKVYDGPGLIADRTHAPLIPVRIDGAECTPFSYMKGVLPTHWGARIVITVLPPVALDIPPEYKERRRRQHIGDKLYEIMSQGKFATANLETTLWQELLDVRKHFGGDVAVLEDVERVALTFDDLLLRATVLGLFLDRDLAPDEQVGIFLPNSAATGIAFFALQFISRIPVMLNAAGSKESLLAACRKTSVRTVLTSRRFIKTARLEDVAATLAQSLRLIYLEDARKSLRKADCVKGYVLRKLSKKAYLGKVPKPDDTAAIFFTAGRSRGEPKAVALSHRNIVANRYQITARIDCTPKDAIFNPLPMCTPYGMILGFLLPLYLGARSFLFPSLMHVQFVPELVYDWGATILFGTDTSLMRYAEVAHPYDFRKVRYIFSGVEPLQEETRRLWANKFGLRIFEGYGLTEGAPILAMNTPMYNEGGTVGKFLPGVEAQVIPVQGQEEGGALRVRGPNLTLGYIGLKEDGFLTPLTDGWLDTGDMVSISENGFVTILGRIPGSL